MHLKTMPTSLLCLSICLLNDLHILPKCMAIIYFSREFLNTSSLYGTSKAMACFHWSISSAWHRWCYCRSKWGPISCYLRHRCLGPRRFCKAASPFYNQQVHILHLQNECMTEVISDWHLSCHFSQLLVSLPTAFPFSKISSVRGS